MKKIIRLLTVALLLFAMSTSAFATEVRSPISNETVYLGNGLTMTNEVTVATTRSSEIAATRTATMRDGDVVIAQIAFQAVFYYDGRTVYVISKTVTRTDTYANWNYREKSFTSSGGTVTLEAKLTKFLIFSNNITMSLHCDANGNITYS